MWTRRAVLASGAAAAAAILLPARGFAASNQLRLALSAEPPHLDPTAPKADAATMAVSYQNLFEGLTRIDEQGRAQPGLAKSWTSSPDGLDWAFTLQPVVRYHDGTSFDAGHVVFSLNRLLAPGSQNPQKARFATIAEVTAADDAIVKLRLKQKHETLLFDLGRAEASIVAPESADNNGTVPIGTGPFALTQWDPGNGILLERNEDYWGVHPRISQATLSAIPDPGAGVKALLANQIDGYPHFPAPDALAPLKGNSAYHITTGMGPDKQPRLGAWNSQLTGMWVDAPVEGCVLAGIRWRGDTGAPEVGPAPYITNEDN